MQANVTLTSTSGEYPSRQVAPMFVRTIRDRHAAFAMAPKSQVQVLVLSGILGPDLGY